MIGSSKLVLTYKRKQLLSRSEPAHGNTEADLSTKLSTDNSLARPGKNEELSKECSSENLKADSRADGSRTTGCYNTLCLGFVQVSPEIPLGTVLQPVSTYAGLQFEIAISIHQDALTGNLWLVFGGDKNVGYWPKSIFTTLDDGATKVSWGGETFSSLTEATPAMGSGHFAEKGYMKSSYFNRLQIAFQSGRFVDPTAYDLITYDPDPKCYNVINDQKSNDDGLGYYFYFGALGLCKPQ